MTIRDMIEQRWISVRNLLKSRQARLEEAQKEFEDKVKIFRSSWKQEVIRRADGVFCFVMESLEKALSRFNRNKEDVNEPIVTSNDWIQ